MNDTTAALTVIVSSDVAEGVVDLDRWQRLATSALATEQVPGGELNLLFVGEDAMAELNSQHMGKVGATDVLAFPIDGLGQPESDEPTLVGDVVICPAVAAKNAQSNGVLFDDELALLVVHGVLHVLGHDHAEPDETALMKSREQALLNAHHRS